MRLRLNGWVVYGLVYVGGFVLLARTVGPGDWLARWAGLGLVPGFVWLCGGAAGWDRSANMVAAGFAVFVIGVWALFQLIVP